MTRAKQAAEVIAEYLGWDLAEVKDMAYRRGRTIYPIFSISQGVICCPPAGKKPPQDRDDQPGNPSYDWRVVATMNGRAVYTAGDEA